MPISFSMIVLSSQLVVTVADGVPKFDIARQCRLDSTQAFDLSAGLNETVKKCVADEQQALIHWERNGLNFASPTRRNAPRKQTLTAHRVMLTS
jgi:hypothetical protein